jgi:DNA-directed RNA polymerase subunit beta'
MSRNRCATGCWVVLWPAMFPIQAGDEIAIPAGTLLDEHWVAKLDEWGIDLIMVRSAITCQTRYGICAACYGRDLARGHRVNSGEAVGVIAAQSIGEPGTQLTMRTFHIGGAASRTTVADSVQVKAKGILRLHKMKVVRSAAMTASGRRFALGRNHPGGRARP